MRLSGYLAMRLLAMRLSGYGPWSVSLVDFQQRLVVNPPSYYYPHIGFSEWGAWFGDSFVLKGVDYLGELYALKAPDQPLLWP